MRYSMLLFAIVAIVAIVALFAGQNSTQMVSSQLPVHEKNIGGLAYSDGPDRCLMVLGQGCCTCPEGHYFTRDKKCAYQKTYQLGDDEFTVHFWEEPECSEREGSTRLRD